jgi:ribonuclease HI
MKLKVHTDGGSRGNPGPAAIGVVIETESDGKMTFNKSIGNTTNNIAEYTALQAALDFMSEKYNTCEANVEFYLDSELIVKQMNKVYKVKDPTLKTMYEAIQVKLQNYATVAFTHVYREYNKEADALVNQALDSLPK